MELHDRKVAWVVTVWKPIHNVLSKFRKSWNVRTSIIDSFTTFFLLSYVKVLNVTTDLLIPTVVYKLDSSTPMVGLYYSPSISYFGDEHRPYAILAIIIFILFTITPTLTLFLYSFQFFIKFSHCSPSTGTFSMPLLTPFKGATRMVLNLEHLTVDGLQLSYYSFAHFS